MGEERAEDPASTKYLYSYDKAGNRMSMELLGTDNRQHVEYTYNSLNQLTMLKDRTQNTESIFNYDKDGNLTADNCGIYGYDDFNHMTRAEMNNGDLFTCRYDAEGLRHEAEENGKLIQYIYSGRNVVVEETEEESIRYIRGNGRLIVSDSDRARCYYHYVSDQLGSVGYVLDGDTTKTITDRIKCHYEYDAFGNTIVCEENIHNPFRFTGEQYDAVTNLYYLRARYYNPVIGRFTQQDTYLGDGLNLYAYVQNNPVKYVDPSGHGKQLGVPDGKTESDAKKILGPYYDILLEKHEKNPDYYVHPNNYKITEGEEYVRNRAEYTELVNRGELEPGHHKLGVADGGENVQSNITFTGEKFLTRDMLPQAALDYYDAVYARPSNPHPKRIAVYEQNGKVYFGKNPLHTEATNLQKDIHNWQKANGYRRK